MGEMLTIPRSSHLKIAVKQAGISVGFLMVREGGGSRFVKDRSGLYEKPNASQPKGEWDVSWGEGGRSRGRGEGIVLNDDLVVEAGEEIQGRGRAPRLANPYAHYMLPSTFPPPRSSPH